MSDSDSLSQNSDPTLSAADAAAARFLAAWRETPKPDLRRFLPTAGADRSAVLEELILLDLEQRIAIGETPDADEYLREFHELEDRGDWRAQWEEVRRQCLQLSEPTTVSKPSEASSDERLGPGVKLGDFELLRLLGRGGHGEVYLARDCTLDRQVALKISPQQGSEGRTLARLNHPHIAPVYQEQTHGSQKLLAIGYIAPGATLAQWLEHQKTLDPNSWRPAQWVRWLRRKTSEQASNHAPAALPERSFAQLAARWMREIALALDHAHRQGVVHRDIKPANILLDLQGRAVLTDFNVSTAEEKNTSAEQFGGTMAYMAPEHVRAMESWLPGSPEDVDARSDVYSLGVVCYELLAGVKPWAANSSLPAGVNLLLAEQLRQAPVPPPRAPGFRPSLGAIVEKCLQPDPQRRYSTAGRLAEDLQQWLTNKPPRYATDPSWRERWGRYRMRLAVAVVVLMLTAGLLYWQSAPTARLQQVESRLKTAEQQIQEGKLIDGLASLEQAERGLSRAEGVFTRFHLGAAKRSENLRERWRELSRTLTRRTSRRIAEDTERRRAASMRKQRLLPPSAIDRLTQPSDWENSPPFRNLPDDEKKRQDEDITEFLWYRAYTQGGLSQQELTRFPKRHRSLLLLEQAARSPDWPEKSIVIKPDRSGGEFETYLQGAALVWRGEFPQAAEVLKRSAELRDVRQGPRFWASFWRAYSLQKSQQYEQAIIVYNQCLGSRPGFALTYYNLGLAYAGKQDFPEAISALKNAVRLQPTMAEAHESLGVLYYRQQEYQLALDSLWEAIRRGRKTSDAYMNRGAAYAALEDYQAARRDLEEALKIDPRNQAARENLQRLKER